jgi:predicted acylesterase/phospholipase RssA
MITGLVLQGGGALGAFEVGVIEWLLDHGIKPDVVSGVSIGAINATVLAGSKHADPRVALRALWKDLTTLTLPPPFDAANSQVSLFGNPGMYRPRSDYLNVWHWTSLYELGPLRTTLKTHVNFDKLRPENFDLPRDEQAPQLILTATNLASGRLDRFDSRLMQLMPEHVAASGSLPPAFPMTTAIGPGRGEQPMPYWDGGLFDNTPLSKVIDALEASQDADMTMYVVNLFPSAAPIPRTLPDVIARMVTLAFSNRTEKDVRRAKRTTQIIKFAEEIDRLMATHPELERLKNHPGYRAIKDRKRPIHIVEITNIDVTGPSDFSPEAIETRRLRGYAATDAAVAEDKRRRDELLAVIGGTTFLEAPPWKSPSSSAGD